VYSRITDSVYIIQCVLCGKLSRFLFIIIWFTKINFCPKCWPRILLNVYLYYYHVADKSIRRGGLFYVSVFWLNPMTGFLVSSVRVHKRLNLYFVYMYCCKSLNYPFGTAQAQYAMKNSHIVPIGRSNAHIVQNNNMMSKQKWFILIN